MPRSRGAGVAAGCLALALGLGACGSDVDLPDITLPDVTPPDFTLPDITPPDITLPTLPGGGGEEPTGEPTDAPTTTEPPTVTVTETATADPPPPQTETATQTETVTVTTPTTAEPTGTDTAAATEQAQPEEEPADDAGIPWWLWLLAALVLLGLVSWLLARRSAAVRARRAWAERVDTAVDRLTHPQNVLRRPATLVPADQEAVRRAVAELRDLSMTFGELSSTAPDPELGLEAAGTADALRALATAAEIENEGLATGRIAAFEERQDAEARRLAALQDVDAAVGRLMTRLAA